MPRNDTDSPRDLAIPSGSANAAPVPQIPSPAAGGLHIGPNPSVVDAPAAATTTTAPAPAPAPSEIPPNVSPGVADKKPRAGVPLDKMAPEVQALFWEEGKVPGLRGTRMHAKDIECCQKHLGNSAMFQYVKKDNTRQLCRQMRKVEFSQGDVLFAQGERQTHMLVLEKGSVERVRVAHGQMHVIDNFEKGDVVGSLHVLKQEPSFASTRVTSPEATAFTLSSEQLRRSIGRNSDLAEDMIFSLTSVLRRQSKMIRLYSTPLLEQRPKVLENAYIANSVAAGVESFYRSALNAKLNHILSGKTTPYFPDMHIQTPLRIMYINGFKEIRRFLDDKVYGGRDSATVPVHIKVGLAVAPGIAMTPVSSLIEACNATSMNPEPLARRWMRGLTWRCAREVVFGVGLNQMSDFFEERYEPLLGEHSVVANMTGSLTAGVVSGYLSHIPHNLATMKLMRPGDSYSTLMGELRAEAALHRVPADIPPSLRAPASWIYAVCFPKGVIMRTTQIVGSFTLLNGIIHAFRSYQESGGTPSFPPPSSGKSSGAKKIPADAPGGRSDLDY